MKSHQLILFILFFGFGINSGFSQQNQLIKQSIQWNQEKLMQYKDSFSYLLQFKNASGSERYIGHEAYSINIPIDKDKSIRVSLANCTSIPMPGLKIPAWNESPMSSEFEVSVTYFSLENQKYARINTEVFRNQKGIMELLKSFDLQIDYETALDSKDNSLRTYREHSVLATGDWYKVRIQQDGIYKISATEFSAIGINISNLNINHIHLHGNGGTQLPEVNSEFKLDDLEENAIKVVDVNDNGLFESSDYILFYGKGVNRWIYNSTTKRFNHSKHLYDDFAYYYIHISTAPALRIDSIPGSILPATAFVSEFTDFAVHNNDSLNLIKSGRYWYGENFDVVTSYGFTQSFPNLITSKPIYLRSELLARSSVSSTYNFKVNGSNRNITLPPVGSHYLDPYATSVIDTFSILSNSSSININITYNKPSSGAQGWLNFYEINAQRELKMVLGQLVFNAGNGVTQNQMIQFSVQNTLSSTQVWDVTNPTKPKIVPSIFNVNQLTFNSFTDTIKTFALHHSDYLATTFIAKIENQDLHGLSNIDYVIVYAPQFKSEAEELADFHRNINQLKVYTVTPETIYNEFSSGTKDITAIRDFMKMLYDKAEGDHLKEPKYLLLFGDASYDYKGRLSPNHNFVPTYESANSLAPTYSYATDDYYGLLTNNEGGGAYGDLDIGIGRLPVTTNEQARQFLDKMIIYHNLDSNSQHNQCNASENEHGSWGDWRSILCFVADDQDNDEHFIQADFLGSYVGNNYPSYNIDKIYFDAYNQITTPGGQRYPDAKEALMQRVEKGALIINYTGHGGEEGWAHESVLEVVDINSWTNTYKMPLFMTATCEFSRYDDPARISAGEYVFLNPVGGGIGLFTTSRVTYSSSNFALSKVVYQNMFEKVDGQYPTLGEILRKAKVGTGSITANRNFVLLGDPAMRLAYPQKEIKITALFDEVTGLPVDTIKALQKVRIQGNVLNSNQSIDSNFNGLAFPSILDKAQTYTTLGNDPESSQRNFKLQKNILYKGKSEVKNGFFEFTFVVPKDIAYNYGVGKISVYANNSTEDALGSNLNFEIGGTANQFTPDEQGPFLSLFMNDTLFKNGGITNQNPVLLVHVFDENGINTIGNGIGHDLTAILDQNSTNPIVLNDYYESDINNFKSGAISYPFFDLAEGEHQIDVKVWDVYNNSASDNISFIVASSSEFVIKNLLNAPNPFTDQTSFLFEHNQSCETLEVSVYIYDVRGQLIQQLDGNVDASGYKVGMGQLVWNGHNGNGQTLEHGVYIYKIKVSNEQGQEVWDNNKLVLLK